MKIKSRLQLNTYSSITLILGVGVVLFFMGKSINEATERNKHFFDLSQSLFELIVVTNDYLLYKEELSLEQWHSKYASIHRLLNAPPSQKATDESQLASLRKDHEEIKNIFTKLIASIGKAQQPGSYSRLQTRLVGKIQTMLQGMNFKAKELVSESQKEVNDSQEYASMVIIGIVLLTVVVISINSFLLRLSIIMPIMKLQEGTAIVGKGNLDHRIGSTAAGEVGELTRAFDDMTERVSVLNRKLSDNVEDLERSNHELQQYAYVASHDLQSPLRSIVSYLQLLQKRLKGDIDEKGEKYINRSIASGKLMQVLIQDLLNYSKVGSNHKKFTEVDCGSIFDEVLNNLGTLIHENEAQVTHGELPKLTGEQSLFLQLFQNLIGNAIKYRGSVPPKVHVEAKRQTDGWIFSVQDNGIGLEPEYAERIFVIFQRLHGKHEYSGTGIGLAICKKIVERHAGRIWVESELGSGATFYFTIPHQNNPA